MNLKIYVLQLTKKLTLDKANEFADGFRDYFSKKGLKIFYKVIVEGNPKFYHEVNKVIFYREIDKEDSIIFREELKLKSKLTDLKLYRGGVIQ